MSQETYDAPGTSSSIDPFKLVFHVDIFILAAAGVFALASFPRAIARFSRAAEWRQGHILRSVNLEQRRPRRPAMRTVQSLNEQQGSSEGPADMTTEESHTYFSHSHLVRHPQAKPAGWSLPPHVRAWSSIVPPVASLLRYRIEAGLSLGQVLILTIYFSVLIYATFLDSNPFDDPYRSGFVAMSQIPVVYILATKNNLLGMFIGVGYEKLNYIHRFAGKMLLLASNIHALGYFYQWSYQGTFKKWISYPSNSWGLAALICLDILYFFSTSFWRQKAYNIFFASHALGFVVFLPAVYYHQPTMLPYILTAAGAYGFDHLLRLLKTRLCNARIRPIPDMVTTRVEIPELNAGWRAGQHVRLRIISSGMGWWGWTETHPFTIAGVSKTQEGLVLFCKKTGGWTSKLYEMAKIAGYGERGFGSGRNVKVMIEGPYGGPGHSVFASYSAAIFVVGGSGITFALAALQDLLQRDAEGASRVKIIEVIWSVQDPSSLTPLVPQFTALIQQSVYAPLRISVHYTRASASPELNKEFLPPGLSLSAGRPKTAKVLDAVISQAVSYGSGVKASMDITGVVVAVCGPVGLGDEVSGIIAQVDAGRRWAVGGIELHEEVFGW